MIKSHFVKLSLSSSSLPMRIAKVSFKPMVLSQSVHMIFTHQKRCQMTISICFLCSLQYLYFFLFHFARFIVWLPFMKCRSVTWLFDEATQSDTQNTAYKRKKERSNCFQDCFWFNQICLKWLLMWWGYNNFEAGSVYLENFAHTFRARLIEFNSQWQFLFYRDQWMLFSLFFFFVHCWQ